MNKISIIVPVLNESVIISEFLQKLQNYRKQGHEIIVVDGGSTDSTEVLAKLLSDKIIRHSKGRARQMNAGAKESKGDVLLFLHADTCLPEQVNMMLSRICAGEEYWGFFDIQFSGEHWAFRIISWSMNIRSRITGIGTGDQAIFISRKLFQRAEGFDDIELMEDISICRKLKRIIKPIHPGISVITSSRRWEKQGILRTIIKMWYIRLAFFLGVDPLTLSRQYET